MYILLYVLLMHPIKHFIAQDPSIFLLSKHQTQKIRSQGSNKIQCLL